MGCSGSFNPAAPGIAGVPPARGGRDARCPKSGAPVRGPRQMIIRAWRGRAAPTNPQGYPKHFRDHVAPELARLPGFVGASLGKRSVEGAIEFLVLTRWESLEHIKQFAGS